MPVNEVNILMNKFTRMQSMMKSAARCVGPVRGKSSEHRAGIARLFSPV